MNKVREAVENLIRMMIVDALTLEQGSRTRAARSLGVPLRTLRYWIHKFNLAEQFPAETGRPEKIQKEPA